MKNEQKPIEKNSEAFESVVKHITDTFATGELIPHDFLKDKFFIRYPDHKEFPDMKSFIDALDILQFTYMSLIDKLRTDILEIHNYYLLNVRGEGYVLMPPKDQIAYAYKQATTNIKREMKEALNIMTHVRHEEISSEQRVKDNDLLAKLSMFKQIADSALRKK